MAVHSSNIVWKFQGQRSLEGYSPWGCKTQTRLSTHTHTRTHLILPYPQPLAIPNLQSVFMDLVFPGSSTGKESTCNAEDLGSTPGLGRSPGEGNGYPLQYSGLENSMDCIVHGGHKELIYLYGFTYSRHSYKWNHNTWPW